MCKPSLHVHLSNIMVVQKLNKIPLSHLLPTLFPFYNFSGGRIKAPPFPKSLRDFSNLKTHEEEVANSFGKIVVSSSVLTIAFKYSVVLKSCSVYHRLTDPTCPKLSKLHTVLNQPKGNSFFSLINIMVKLL